MRTLKTLINLSLGALLLCGSLAGRAQLTIDVIGGGASQIPITVLPLGNEQNYDQDQKVSEVVSADLRPA